MGLLSEEKVSHLSHVILAHLQASSILRFKGDPTSALRVIKRVLAAELSEEEALGRIVRARLSSYARPIPEGSPEWDTLYRQTLEEEQRKRFRP